jgi:hypothetical protein
MDETWSDHTDYSADPFRQPPEEPVRLVIGVYPHPLHGRLVDQMIFWVRPYLIIMGVTYKLTWWGDGVAYYQPISG